MLHQLGDILISDCHHEDHEQDEADSIHDVSEFGGDTSTEYAFNGHEQDAPAIQRWEWN